MKQTAIKPMFDSTCRCGFAKLTPRASERGANSRRRVKQSCNDRLRKLVLQYMRWICQCAVLLACLPLAELKP